MNIMNYDETLIERSVNNIASIVAKLKKLNDANCRCGHHHDCHPCDCGCYIFNHWDSNSITYCKLSKFKTRLNILL